MPVLFCWRFVAAFIGVILVLSAGACCVFYGRSSERTKILVQAEMAFQNREKINDEVLSLSPFHLCLALGGVSKECATILRRLDKTSRR
ncbi:hypothetical protein [Bartonella australis]|nr:hypothetical protein [Bartonella australis]